ncbi:hypothetical protein SD70_01785 [Gordoniibacillus kamchatkensis]|uniref:ABC transmembrane type-1 domain-containing protein n=1 Tax=Gordoniibacillus kamchatkensis TaxID=1590651 RepID=A0ABR5AP13_9BACL|nr:sugar ABC transporter permease [Paenibacillus sp. VKM B-2647]KIL42280.1 hypothetical protein SD70_01785 [Paenibacillus sp. VKM B-2647]
MDKNLRVKQWIWIGPPLIMVSLLTLVVLSYAVYLGVHDVNLLKKNFSYTGFGNFVKIWHDARAWSSVWKTVKFVFIGTLLEAILGLALALYLHKDFKLRKITRSLLLIPMIMTPVVSALIWRIFYDPYSGIINYLLGIIGLGGKHDWLGNPDMALYSLIITDIWQWTPFVFLILASGLDSLPAEPYEAAKVDGASRFNTFWHITLPLLKPVILIAVMLRVIDSIKTFDLIYVMTRGGPALKTETLNMYTYVQGMNNFNISYASALSISITIVLTILFVYFYKNVIAQKN